MLLATPDLKKKWSYSVEWLHDELERVRAEIFGCFVQFYSIASSCYMPLVPKKLTFDIFAAQFRREQSIFVQQLVAACAVKRNFERLLPGALTLCSHDPRKSPRPLSRGRKSYKYNFF